MGVKVRRAEGEMRSGVVAYLRGIENCEEVWYRVVVDSSSQTQDKPVISPIAVIPRDIFGVKGGWAVIGDDIYYAGGLLLLNRTGPITVCKDMVKHNIHVDDPTSWDIVSSMRIPRSTAFVAATGRKLSVVAGIRYYGYYDGDSDDDDYENLDDPSIPNWSKCGEVYDVDTQSWEYLSSRIAPFSPYHSYQATIVEKQQDSGYLEPTQIVFYSLSLGSMLFLDAATGRILEDAAGHPDFALWQYYLRTPPKGLEGCKSLVALAVATRNAPAVFRNRTFYWFTYELRLYGYDMDLKRWFRSPCLQSQLHPLKPMRLSQNPHSPIMLGLPNDKLLVTICQVLGEFTVATLALDRQGNSLRVSVEHIQYFNSAHRSFRPYDGMIIRLKNTGSGTRTIGG